MVLGVPMPKQFRVSSINMIALMNICRNILVILCMTFLFSILSYFLAVQKL